MSETTSGTGPEGEGSTPDGGSAAVTAGGGAPASADLMQAVTMIDRGVKERRDTDTILMNYWLYFFLVSWVTFGIYTIVLFFKRINRIDGFSSRKGVYYNAVIDWTERYARQQGKEDAVHHLLGDMRSEVQAAYGGDMRRIGAGVSFLLTLVTLGIYGLYVLYRMNRYWWDAQVLEQDFDDKLSQAWSTLGLMRYPISFTLDQGKRRSYALYLILSIVTFGIWAIVWDYKIQTDPENLFREFHSIEDTVVQAVRAH
jgi:uncharacterized protein DUF4234